MKQSLVKKWFPLVALCLALLGLPALLGACKLDGAPPIGTSSRNPYTISASQGTCTVWTLTLDGVGGKPWCASTVPAALHVGDNVRLSFGVLFQDFQVTAMNAAQRHISLGV
jgi:hypothetical protein